MRDPAFRPWWLEELWLRTFPDAPVLRLADAGHHLQEDAHERIVPELLGFLSRRPPSAAQEQRRPNDVHLGDRRGDTVTRLGAEDEDTGEGLIG
jgi:hypothetical protein